DGLVAARALDLLSPVRPQIVVDLHNNTGHNPAYVVTARLDPMWLSVGSLFANRFVRSELRLGTFMEAFDSSAVAVTIECGTAGTAAADATAWAGLVRLLSLP